METDFYNANPQTGTSTYIAMGSFCIGTMLLFLRLTMPNEESLLFIGFFYVLFAILINSLVLLNLCYQFIITPNERKTIAIRILILLANIPIALLYFYIVVNEN
ncbi:hypothetical protein [Flavobacterium sp. XGLA_31]|uniref:hypothetical protein n=1 Tax=Flavobacterium sp. XGLA_31 TaxID=3447666 RepID=UPI003F3D4153